MNAFERYTEQVRGVLDKVQKTQAVQIDKAAEAVANAVAQDGLVHTFGTGHSHMVAEEIVYRAGSLAPVNAILEPSLTGDQQVTKSEYTERMEGWGEIIVDYQQVSTKDVMIVISNSGRNAAPPSRWLGNVKNGGCARNRHSFQGLWSTGHFKAF